MLCVIAKLDDAATEKLEALRQAALPGGETAKRLYGHITVASYLGADELSFIRACKALLTGFPAFAVSYVKLEVLEESSVLVASPEKSGALLSLHRRIAERWPDSLDKWTATERWHPHTTLLHSPTADLQALRRKMEAAFSPFSARVGRIEFSRVTDDGYEILDRAELSPP